MKLVSSGNKRKVRDLLKTKISVFLLASPKET